MDAIEFAVNALALVLSAFGLVQGVPRLRRILRYWPLLRFWRLGGTGSVWIVCSEADSPEARQWPEEREFIYLMKYGDVDALFEVALTLERIYLSLRFRIMSSGEFERATGNLPRHMIAIGGPDYNALTRRLLDDGKLRIRYRSPYVEQRCGAEPDEIALVAPNDGTEIFSKIRDKDFGYIERIANPWASKGTITVLGGNHTIGVTAAAKLFSVIEEGRFEVTPRTKANYRHFRRHVKGTPEFGAIFPAEKVGTVIAQPDLIQASYIAGHGPKPTILSRLTSMFNKKIGSPQQGTRN